MTDLQTLIVAVLTAVALFGLLRETWRNGWLPMQCALCHRFVQYRHSRAAQMTLGVWVRLCDGCYKMIYPGG